jgi:cobalt/nickel transport system permease protein
MKDRPWLLAWGCAVVATTLVHQPAWLAVGIAVALLASGPGRRALSWRALRAVLPVLALISAGYVAMALLAGGIAWHYLALLNARVLLLAYLAAWAVRDIDIAGALQGWPGAQRWFSIVRAQGVVFRRLATEYRDALRSRTTVPPTLGQRYRASAALGLAALDKAVYNSAALTQGMRSRGALDE